MTVGRDTASAGENIVQLPGEKNPVGDAVAFAFSAGAGAEETLVGENFRFAGPVRMKIGRKIVAADFIVEAASGIVIGFGEDVVAEDSPRFPHTEHGAGIDDLRIGKSGNPGPVKRFVAGKELAVPPDAFGEGTFIGGVDVEHMLREIRNTPVW